MGGPAGARRGTSPFRAGGDGPRRGGCPWGDTSNRNPPTPQVHGKVRASSVAAVRQR